MAHRNAAIIRLDRSQLSLRQMLSLDACTRCGECLPACPVLATTGSGESTALSKIDLWRRALRRGTDRTPAPSPPPQLPGRAPRQPSGVGGMATTRPGLGLLRPVPSGRLLSAAYDCTLCGRCEAVCPVYIRTHDLWVAQRRQLAVAGLAPDAVLQMAERVRQSGNIAGSAAEERLAWLANAGEGAAPAPASAHPDVVLFVGCLSSLYPQAFALPQALLGLLRLLGVNVAILGESEVCCGFPLYASGLEQEAFALARRNVELLKGSGARKVITSCPSCYHTLNVLYRRWLGAEMDLPVLHSTQYLDGLAGELAPRLRPLAEPLAGPITYHDPCDLGRLSGIYEPPRRLLRLIPGLELVEMAEHHEQALCCGGGGDVEMVNAGLSGAIAGRRLAQGQATGARALATACPQCKRALTSAARSARIRLRTYDVAELLLLSAEGK